MPSGPNDKRSARHIPAAWGEHLVGSLKTLWRCYRKKLKLCQKHFSEESVHDLRVETRRLLSMLELLGALDSHDYLRQARGILKKRLDAFDGLRDTQVQLLRLKRSRRAFPTVKTLRRALKRRERRLITTTAREVKASRTGKLARQMVLLKKALQKTFADPAVASRRAIMLAQTVERAFERVVALRQRIDPARTTTIHRTRIGFKKFRYMVECLQPVLPGVTREQIGAMHDYQTGMGDIQDIETLLARLDRLSAKKKIKAKPLQPFRDELIRQRALSVKAYLKSADQLYAFRPANLEQLEKESNA
jgi:CHAD domain-containing protein